MRRVCICGSRVYPDLDRVRALVASLPASTVLVTDSAAGVAATALEAAKARKMTVAVHYPIDGQGAAMGAWRRMFKDCELAIVFWSGEPASGTRSKIRMAREMDLPVRVYTPSAVQEDFVSLVKELMA